MRRSQDLPWLPFKSLNGDSRSIDDSAPGACNLDTPRQTVTDILKGSAKR